MKYQLLCVRTIWFHKKHYKSLDKVKPVKTILENDDMPSWIIYSINMDKWEKS
ncbi:MAG: hypothetical protein CENE_01813 [Candidatus Celerinatantimonas neptuna]|nr:MAG: hypothetical protein CENE_01813 [Candidatus Celerinatantimonas neptuna]